MNNVKTVAAELVFKSSARDVKGLPIRVMVEDHPEFHPWFVRVTLNGSAIDSVLGDVLLLRRDLQMAAEILLLPYRLAMSTGGVDSGNFYTAVQLVKVLSEKAEDKLAEKLASRAAPAPENGAQEYYGRGGGCYTGD